MINKEEKKEEEKYGALKNEFYFLVNLNWSLRPCGQKYIHFEVVPKSYFRDPTLKHNQDETRL